MSTVDWNDITNKPAWVQQGIAPNADKVDSKDIAIVEELPGNPDEDTIYYVKKEDV